MLQHFATTRVVGGVRIKLVRLKLCPAFDATHAIFTEQQGLRAACGVENRQHTRRFREAAPRSLAIATIADGSHDRLTGPMQDYIAASATGCEMVHSHTPFSWMYLQKAKGMRPADN